MLKTRQPSELNIHHQASRRRVRKHKVNATARVRIRRLNLESATTSSCKVSPAELDEGLHGVTLFKAQVGVHAQEDGPMFIGPQVAKQSHQHPLRFEAFVVASVGPRNAIEGEDREAIVHLVGLDPCAGSSRRGPKVVHFGVEARSEELLGHRRSKGSHQSSRTLPARGPRSTPARAQPMRSEVSSAIEDIFGVSPCLLDGKHISSIFAPKLGFFVPAAQSTHIVGAKLQIGHRSGQTVALGSSPSVAG